MKFGIDIPWFGDIGINMVERIKKIMGNDTTEIIERIANEDEELMGLLKEIKSMPDITNDQLDEQLKKCNKLKKR